MQPRIRKDYRSLEPFERQRFFYCLKMLEILPPQQPGNRRAFHIAWKYEDGQRYYKTVQPVNIHDEFIGSHQTSCEHSMPYFAYYHRHLVVCVEIALNYAEEVLLAGPRKLPSELYERHGREFDLVFQKYRQIIDGFRKEQNITGQLPLLAMHYWDGTDYTQELEIPLEIREHEPEQIDKLCYAVNQHYPWNFNFATRWFRDRGEIPKGFETNGFFRSEASYYSDLQSKIIRGQLNPRSDPSEFLSSSLTRYGSLSLVGTASDINSYKNYRSLVTTKNTIDLCTLDSHQINALYGNKTKNMQWITKQERDALPYSSLRTRAYTYNKAVPHFQYAYSLFKESNSFLRNYVSTYNQHYENSMENVHNTMHNNLQRFMSDAQLSITHPVFFMYHSWIDMALETKARMVRNSNKSRSEYNSTRGLLDNVKFYSILNQVVSRDRPITFGQYPIFQWCVPINRLRDSGIVLGENDYQAPFPGYGYVLNDKVRGIRLSSELDEFYKQNYVEQQAHRYKHYEGFKSYNFNYTYEVRDYQQGQVVNRKMEGSQVPVPSFIMDIYNDYDSEWNRNKVRDIGRTTDEIKLRSAKTLPPEKQEKVGKKPNQGAVLMSAPPKQDQKETPVQSSSVHPQPVQEFSGVKPVGLLNEEVYFNNRDLLKAIRQAFAGLATFSSTIKSTTVHIELQMTELGYQHIKLSQQHRAIMKEGLVISIIPLFTRGSGATVCPNCKAQKTIFIECTENLAEMNEALFCELARGLSREVVFRLQNEKVVDMKIPRLSELFTLTTAQKVFERLQILEGSNQMAFDIYFQGKEHYENSSIKINAYSYSVQTGQLANIVSKANFKLESTAQFPPIIGIADTETSSQYFLFKKVKVFITNGDLYQEFTFEITTFHDLIRYRMDIIEREGKDGKYVDVVIKDQDFQFKQTHYNNKEYVL